MSCLFWMDTHVHLYEKFSVDAVFDQAIKRFSSHFDQTQYAKNCHHSVLFTFSSEAHPEMNQYQTHSKKWHCLEYGGHFAATYQDKQVLCVVGQQLVSSEGVEVLYIGEKLVDYTTRQPLTQLLDNLQGCIILPWGFGKWLGNRGKIVQNICDNPHYNTRFYLGDISARKSQLGGNNLFTTQKIKQLRGSDLLPISGEVNRVAEFGSVMSSPICDCTKTQNTAELITQVIDALRHPNTLCVKPFGEPSSWVQTLFTQLQLRLL